MTVSRRLKLNKMKIGEKYISTQIIRDPSFTMSVACNRAIKKRGKGISGERIGTQFTTLDPVFGRRI